MQPFAQQAAEYPSLIGMLPYFSAGVRKMSCNRVHFHAITGKKERQRRCMNVARRPKRFGSSANFAAAFYGNPPLRGHLRNAGGLPGRDGGVGVLRLGRRAVFHAGLGYFDLYDFGRHHWENLSGIAYRRSAESMKNRVITISRESGGGVPGIDKCVELIAERF